MIGEGEKKEKLISPQILPSLFNYMSCRLIYNFLSKTFKSLFSYSYLLPLLNINSILRDTGPLKAHSGKSLKVHLRDKQ